jgi:hypothetical protein
VPRTLHVATTNAWIWDMISIIVVHARNIANILKHVVEDNVLIQTMIRGIVENAIIVVKLVSIVSMECAIMPKILLFMESPI